MILWGVLAGCLWIAAIVFMIFLIRDARKKRRIFVWTTFMWADENDNPTFYMLGMTRLYSLLAILLLPLIFVCGVFVWVIWTNP